MFKYTSFSSLSLNIERKCMAFAYTVHSFHGAHNEIDNGSSKWTRKQEKKDKNEIIIQMNKNWKLSHSEPLDRIGNFLVSRIYYFLHFSLWRNILDFLSDIQKVYNYCNHKMVHKFSFFEFFRPRVLFQEFSTQKYIFFLLLCFIFGGGREKGKRTELKINRKLEFETKWKKNRQ